MFVLNGGSYAVSAPLWGHLCDRVSSSLKHIDSQFQFPTIRIRPSQPSVHPLAVNAVGAFLILAGFTALGPAPFIPAADLTLPIA